MKLIILTGLIVLSSSFASSLNSVGETLESIETEKNAKCRLSKVSRSVCINNLCFSSRTYQCISNNGNFKVKLKLKTQNLFDGNTYTRVRKVVYLK